MKKSVPIFDVSKDRPSPLQNWPAALADLKGIRSPAMISRIFPLVSADSTNQTALMKATVLAHGDLLIADSQTTGRGRFGRSWFSPPGKNLYFSIVLKKVFSPDEIQGLTIMSAVAVGEALEGMVSSPVAIHWPNDVLIGDGKVAGILVEVGGKSAHPHVVVGIGINVLIGRDDFPGDLLRRPTSVYLETDQEVTRRDILERVLNSFGKLYETFIAKGLESIVKLKPALFPFFHHQGIINTREGLIEGIIMGISRSGGLIIRTDSGHQMEIIEGELTYGAIR